jgi:catechol 2,3-dioxygenase-like lactoylglutathione lyase family enzyme
MRHLAVVERLKRIDHVGVIVDDLDRVARFLGEELGLDVVRTVDDPERRLRARFFGCGDASIELIELGDPEARAQRLGDRTARVEHIAIQVDDLDAAAGELAQKGVRMSAAEPMRTAVSRSFFSLPESTGGFMLQFIELTEPL